MTQSKSDLDFLNGLHLMIDSIESSYLIKDDKDYDETYGDLQEPYDVKIGSETMGVRRNNPGLGLKRTDQNASGAPESRRVPQKHGMMTAADEEEQEIEDNRGVASTDWESTDGLPEADHWCPDVQTWHTADHEPAQAPSVHVNVDNNGDDPYQSENEDIEKGGVLAGVARAAAPAIGQAVGEKIGSKIKGNDDDVTKGEYDQNTNLDRESQENSESSVAEPFLNRYAVSDEDEDEGEEDVEKAVTMSFDKSIDILKIWGSVDRILPKTELDIDLVDDIRILKSFDLDETTNVEDLVEGTLVHKMLVDRANRPTTDWWESSMSIAKSIDVVDEPAFFAAYLYYEPDTFKLDDFIDLEKAEVTQGKPQDLEMMPNSSGGSAIDGLGMSADDLDHNNGPKDDECDD